MDAERASDDLRAIREIMERTRQAAASSGAGFGTLWGAVWLVGFLGSHFLPGESAGWLWMIADIIGAAGSIWLGVRIGRRADVRTPVWRPVLLWFFTLFAFDGLLLWLFDLHSMRELGLLITLTVALSFVQAGLFTRWWLGLVGLLIAGLAVGTTLVVPDYFNLSMAGLGGALMLAGVWSLTRDARKRA